MLPYSPSLALRLAEHSAAVYYLPHQFARWSLDQRHAGAMTIERGSTQVGVAYGPDGIIVAARGSEAIGDWGENLAAWRVRWKPVPHGRVHVGFRWQASRVAVELEDAVSALVMRYPDAPVYITGHSLGGALAVLLAPLLRPCGADAIYTFEAPRAGNAAFSAWYDRLYGERTFRVVCIRRGCADLATRIPLSACGWWHVGQPVMIRDGIPYESEAAWEQARAAHPVKPLAQWRIISRLAAGVQAHKAVTLVEELRRGVGVRATALDDLCAR